MLLLLLLLITMVMRIYLCNTRLFCRSNISLCVYKGRASLASGNSRGALTHRSFTCSRIRLSGPNYRILLGKLFRNNPEANDKALPIRFNKIHRKNPHILFRSLRGRRAFILKAVSSGGGALVSGGCVRCSLVRLGSARLGSHQPA